MSIVNTLSPEILDQIPEKKRGTGAVHLYVSCARRIA